MSDAEDDDIDGAEESPIAEPRDFDPRDFPIRFSALRRRARSARHYRHAVLSRDREPGGLAQKMGQYAHAATFGTPRLAPFGPGSYVTSRGAVKEHKGRRAGEAWDQHRAANPDALWPSPREAQIAEAIAAALRSDAHAAPILFSPSARYEVEIEWTIPWFGGSRRRCAGRIDMLDEDELRLADLKSLRDAEPERYAYLGRKEGHHAQAVWYADGCAAAGLGNIAPFLIVVENTPPYCVVTRPLSPRAVEDGRAMYRGWLEKVRADEENHHWGGYSESVVPFDVPDEMPFLIEPDDDSDEPMFAA